MLLGLAVAAGVLLQTFNAGLPDYDRLAQYEPPVMTRIHAADGQLVAEHARERRLYLPIQAVPDLIKAAFLSAEDKNFYEHDGVDVMRASSARWSSICRNSGSGKRPVGASTITQQVAKNFLLTNEVTLRAQDQGGAARAPHRAGLFEGQDLRALPERDLSRPRLLRHRRRGAQLLRQAGQPADDRRGGLSRGAPEGAGELQSAPPRGPRDRAAELGDRPHGRERLHPRRRRRGREGEPARR